MSSGQALRCVLVFHNLRDGIVASCAANVWVNTPDDITAILAAMQDRQTLEIQSDNVTWYDKEYRNEGRPAAQYRPIREYGR